MNDVIICHERKKLELPRIKECNCHICMIDKKAEEQKHRELREKGKSSSWYDLSSSELGGPPGNYKSSWDLFGEYEKFFPYFQNTREDRKKKFNYEK